jgi:hypothetical protein
MGMAEAVVEWELDALSAAGDDSMPAGDPIDEGMMKSSRFMKSAEPAKVAAVAAVPVASVCC